MRAFFLCASLIAGMAAMSQCPVSCTPMSGLPFPNNTLLYYTKPLPLFPFGAYTRIEQVTRKNVVSDTVVSVPATDMEGKTFRVISSTLNYANDISANMRRLTMQLEEISTKNQITYGCYLDLRDSTMAGAPPHSSRLLYGAILIDHFPTLTDLGATYYTKDLFNGRRFEPVTITKVEYGSWDAPVRITYQNAAKQESKDLVICPGNLPANSISNYSFEKYFSCADPMPQKMDAATWDEIRTKINFGDSPETVKQAFAVPPVETTNGIDLVYTYKNFKAIFRDRKLADLRVP